MVKGRLIYGVGINDYDGFVRSKGKTLHSYQVWKGMLRRCYDYNEKSYKTYGGVGVYVCNEWLSFSKFKEWFDKNYIKGCDLDKDSLGVVDFDGNRYYSPESCCFLSRIKNIREKCLRESLDSKIYETKPVSRKSFLNHCKVHGKDMRDFIEIVSEIKTKNGSSLYNYFYIDSQPSDILEVLLKIESKWYLEWYAKYEVNGVTRDEFKKVCRYHGVDISDFIEIKQGDSARSCKKPIYNYFFIKDKKDNELSILLKKSKQDIWYKKYEQTYTRKSVFKKKCLNKGYYYDDFIETKHDTRATHGEYMYTYIYTKDLTEIELKEISNINSKIMWYKQYENKSVARKYFKDRCRKYEVDFNQFIEIYSGDKNNEKRYFYFFKEDQSRQKLEELIELANIDVKNVQWFLQYEEKPVLKNSFKKLCEKHNIHIEDFIEINSGITTKNKVKLYLYYNIKEQTPFKLNELFALKQSQEEPLWYEKYQTKPTLPHNFKDICRNHNVSIDCFIKIDSGETHRGRKKYFYKIK